MTPGARRGGDGRVRCWWPGEDEAYVAYHDREWGRPVTDDNRLFEKLCLEGFQAGLSWLTILRKRDNFRAAFGGFDIATVAAFGAADIERLVGDAGIVRHRGKIVSAVNNARRASEIVDEFQSLAAYIWSWEPRSEPDPPAGKDSLPATTPDSTALAKDLKRRGWTFVGPTTVYAFMQSMGLVNDHIEGCFARLECESERAGLVRPTSGV
ncbi:MAG: DNA-3-methyladenine glycosylase I [Acidimicrobiaceae bacterium]|nr:DNA-3-methyladenine glycosylase I [Acidimicrobiaceae bacterium]MDE0516827.1 DNA-3-methyladenine glycosylase I [Acidimicrobiaceae bacterium]